MLTGLGETFIKLDFKFQNDSSKIKLTGLIFLDLMQQPFENAFCHFKIDIAITLSVFEIEG